MKLTKKTVISLCLLMILCIIIGTSLGEVILRLLSWVNADFSFLSLKLVINFQILSGILLFNPLSALGAGLGILLFKAI